VARRQLLELGLSEKAIEHRVRTRRLCPLWRGVYATVRPALLSQSGRWMAAVLACGDGALLSHHAAAALWGIRRQRPGPIDVSVPRGREARRRGLHTHRRQLRSQDTAIRHGIPVTSPACTITDIAPGLADRRLEAAINEADKLDLVHPAELRAHVDGLRRPGAARIRTLLDRATFTLTDSALERRFVPLVARAGLPRPQTQAVVDGHRVDFYWPALGLVVETDGGRFHRTALQQTADRLRDQAHTASGLAVLRFTHAQVRYEPRHVERTLARTARGLRRAAA
jgi:very-short-patch-repair endonuclease